MIIDHMQGWKISEKDFPAEGTAAQKLAFCVNYAILAPSPYNTQPWYFILNDNRITLCADRRYGLAQIDPDDREMSIYCAAALYNLRLAIRYFGYSETTELFPEEGNPDVLARVKLGERRTEDIDQTQKNLFQAITKRHMNRGLFENRPVAEDILADLQAAATKEGAWLRVSNEMERQLVVKMIMEADHIQMANKNFRREMAAWVDARRMLSGDGMPVDDLSFTDIMGNLSPTILRRFEASDKKAANDQQLLEGAPVIAILGSNAGGPVERMSAGQALERVLLTAQHHGLSVSTLNQPCQVPEMRLHLHDELEHHGRAHMILRIGYGGKVKMTPRRPLSAFIQLEGRNPEAEQMIFGDAGAPTQKQGFVQNLLKALAR